MQDSTAEVIQTIEGGVPQLQGTWEIKEIALDAAYRVTWLTTPLTKQRPQKTRLADRTHIPSPKPFGGSVLQRRPLGREIRFGSFQRW